jgi:hypothetical protein
LKVSVCASIGSNSSYAVCAVIALLPLKNPLQRDFYAEFTQQIALLAGSGCINTFGRKGEISHEAALLMSFFHGAVPELRDPYQMPLSLPVIL